MKMTLRGAVLAAALMLPAAARATPPAVTTGTLTLKDGGGATQTEITIPLPGSGASPAPFYLGHIGFGENSSTGGIQPEVVDATDFGLWIHTTNGATAAGQATALTALGQLHTDLLSGLPFAPSNAAQAHTDAAAIAGNTAHPGSGAMAAVSTTAVTNGFALAVGVIGTRVYLPTSADSITYSVEPAATCGVSAPAVTVSATGPTTVDENLVGEVICIIAATGAPRARAY